jgi:hypothetical protein
MRSHLLLLIAGLALPGWAQDIDEAAERARISAERSRVEAGFEQAQKACYAKFAVSDCIAAARSKRRDALADLRRQEVTLNDAERRRRAEERVRDLESRQAEREKQREEAAAKGLEEQRNREQRSAGKSTRTEKAQSQAEERAAKAARPREEPSPPDTEENLRRHGERVKEAQEHKARVEKRAAESKKDVKPLPVPP